MSRLNLVFLLIFVGLLVWVTLFEPSAVARIQNGAQVVFRPFMKASDRLEIGLTELGSDPLSPAELRVRVAELEQERDRLLLEAIQLDEVSRENNELRRALQYLERSPLQVIAARVISRKPSTWYRSMVIDKGSAHGIEVDRPVIVPLGEKAGLVGKVSEVVGTHSSVVLLLTDEMCQVSAMLENSQEQGILGGQRGTLRSIPELRLRYLSREAEAAPGRQVVSSGTGGLFPPGLLLGEVLTFESGAIDSEATVRPLVDFEALQDVFVVLPVAAAEESGAAPADGDQTGVPAGARERAGESSVARFPGSPESALGSSFARATPARPQGARSGRRTSL